jgi:hypothetical protein
MVSLNMEQIPPTDQTRLGQMNIRAVRVNRPGREKAQDVESLRFIQLGLRKVKLAQFARRMRRSDGALNRLNPFGLRRNEFTRRQTATGALMCASGA